MVQVSRLQDGTRKILSISRSAGRARREGASCRRSSRSSASASPTPGKVQGRFRATGVDARKYRNGCASAGFNCRTRIFDEVVKRKHVRLVSVTRSTIRPAGCAAPHCCRKRRRGAPSTPGALDGLEEKVDAGRLRSGALQPQTVRFGALAHDVSGRRTASRRKLAETAARQDRRSCWAAFPRSRRRSQPQTLEVRDFPGYRREKFVFHSRPGVSVLGYLLHAEDRQRRRTPP